MKKFLSLVLVINMIFLLGCTKNSPSIPFFPSTNTPSLSGNITGTISEPELSIITDNISEPELPIIERKTYENKSDGFSLQVPEDWTFQEDVYGAAVMFYSPTSETDKIRENVGITKKELSKAYTLDDYYAILKEGLITQSSYVEIENSRIKVNDLDAKKIIYKTFSNDMTLQFEQIFFITNGSIYIITYTATEKTFSDFVQKVDEMITTFKIK